MTRSAEIKKAKGVFKILENRFIEEGERISVKEIMDEFFEFRNGVSELKVERKVRSWMRQMKTRIWKKHTLPFGNIDNEGNYGVPVEENEYAFALKNYYIITKGMIVNSKKFRDTAISKGLLTDRIKEEKALLYEIRESLGEGGEDER